MSNLKSTSAVALVAFLVTGCFALTCVYPGWASVAELLVVLGFTGFTLWIDPFRKNEVRKEDFEKLREQYAKVHEEVRTLRFKIFGQKT